MDRFVIKDKSGSGSQGDSIKSRTLSGDSVTSMGGAGGLRRASTPKDLSQSENFSLSLSLSGLSDLEEQDVDHMCEHDQSVLTVLEQSTQELGEEGDDGAHSNPAAVKELKSRLQTMER